jgi:hypothetical protein
MTDVFYFIGKPDGIGNRIEQLIKLQEYCHINNKKCIFIWSNTHRRCYKPIITFDNIEIQTEMDDSTIKILSIQLERTPDFIPRYSFNFAAPAPTSYDIIIHIRAGDRLSNIPCPYHYTTQNELDTYIDKTANYINNQSNITTYAIVSDGGLPYKDKLRRKITKQFVPLPYTPDINKDWLDFYYLTNPNKYVLMCCNFSSYSICASILGNKTLLVFKESLNTTLPRFKASIQIIQ